jgi:hypothetical protein
MIDLLDTSEQGKSLQYDKEWFEFEFAECLVDLNEPVERPETVISIGEHEYKDTLYPTPVMTAGEFSVISAPSKSKKSFLKSQIVASYIGGNADSHFNNIKGHRSEDHYVIDCDTEQSRYYAASTFKRVQKINGKAYENYLPFKMRHLTPEQRVAFIDNLLQSEKYKGKVKLLFIDGIADLIEDSNDLILSNYIAQKVMTWTDQYNIHVCVIIHNAYNTIKPTGHLGSAVVKKAESVILLEPTDESKKVIKVRHLYSRGRAFEDFYFTIKDFDALPYVCDEYGNIGTDKAYTTPPLKPLNPDEAFNNDNDVPF